MNQNQTIDGAAAWRRLVEGNREYCLAWQELFSEGIDRVSLVRKGLERPGLERHTALKVAESLTPTELTQLFEVLAMLASTAHGTIGKVRELILSLPRDWVLAHIEDAAETYLREGTYDEYRRFLELYELLDRDMTVRLAQRAAAHADVEIREAGEEYLERLLAANEVSPRE